MKTLIKNLAMATIMSGAMAVSNPIYSQHPETQKQETPKEQKLFPYLNFYFETGDYKKYADIPEFKKYVKAWLCDCPKDENKGTIFFNYGDTDDDGFYDYVLIDKMDDQIRAKEKFYFNFNTKKIDYVLDIYEFCPKIITDCNRIISKSYNEIDKEESYKIGKDFSERIQKFPSVQKEFSRFNPEALEELVREEFDSRLNLVDGKIVGNSKIPIEKFLSEKEIKEVENYYKEKPERERLKREQEERTKTFKREQEERLKAEKEAKKITARLKIGGGITINSEGGHIGPFLGIIPKLTNKKGKGFAVGLDMFIMNSEIEFEDYGGMEDQKRPIAWMPSGAFKYLISEKVYRSSVLIKTINRLGLNMGYVSPAFEIFANAGFLRQKMLATTTVVTEEYIEEYGVKQGKSSFKTENTAWEKRRFGPFYFGLGMEIFPFLKENSQKKNISFSIEGLISTGGRGIYSSSNYGVIYAPGQSMIKAGLKYTFRK